MSKQLSEKEIKIISSTFLNRINENLQTLESEKENLPVFAKAVELIDDCISKDGKILLCGNGGSGSSASHIVNDFVGHMYFDRQPIRAISLVDNISVLTALSNDYGYDTIFSRQVEALGEEGDVLIGLSTSGNSRNVILAAELAKAKKMSVIAMTNRKGGKLAEIADVCLRANTSDGVCSEHIQIIELHTLCECVEAVHFQGQLPWEKKEK
jgi:D-sedoheptulose 7-phosphate isomerase